MISSHQHQLSHVALQMFFQKAVGNDTLFLSIVNVVDYSILVGFDEDNGEIVVGIIDYLRQVLACICSNMYSFIVFFSMTS